MTYAKNTFCRLALVACLAAAPILAWGSIESGVDAYNGGDYALAMHELMPLAEQGNPQAQTYVASMYANGQGVPLDDTKAIFWFLHAAIGGNTDAQLKLSDIYSLGKGVPADDAIAAYWKWRAAGIIAHNARSDLDSGLDKSIADTSRKPGNELATASNCVPPPYRRDAEHFGEAGTVQVVFLVDPDGKPLQASVLASSDWPRLDRMARDAYGACTFKAAKSDGKPVLGVARMFYEWNPK